MKKDFLKFMSIALLCAFFVGCSEDEPIAPPTPRESCISDYYLLNEGGWKQNNSTLDFYSQEDKSYTTNIFSIFNPDVVLGLGDTGNDLQTYGEKLYAVMNVSGLVEIMDKQSAKHLKAIDIAGVRNIAFHKGYAYVSAYSSPSSSEGVGFVAKIDTASLEIVATCEVGRQPEALTTFDGKLYVCNSGGYTAPAYERHITVSDLTTFTEVEKIDIADNINNIICDAKGKLYIGSAGDYPSVSSSFYIYDIRQGTTTDTLPLAANRLWLDGDKLYILGSDYVTGTQTLAVYDTASGTLNESPFPQSVTSKFAAPYDIAVDPVSKEILVCDAKDFVSLGKIYCLSPDGTNILWERTTGISPGHIVFK